MIIGLTGGIGSGKTTIAKILTTCGFACIDADDIIEALYKPHTKIYKAIIAETGLAVLTNGKIDLDKLRTHNLPQLVQELVLHQMWREVLLFEEKNKFVIFVSARIIEENFPVDHICVIICTAEIQRLRALKRGVNPNALTKIMAKQLPLSQRLEKADSIIENIENIHTLEINVKKLIAQLDASNRKT